MIAFVLQETGRDPAWIIGGIVPQLGGNAGVGDGWLVVEGDESDRSIGSLAPADRGASRTSSSTITRRTHPRPSCARSSTTGSPTCRTSSGAGSCRRSSSSSRCPASTTARTRPRRSPRSSSPASRAPRRRRRSSASPGVGRRLELVGERGGVTVYDDYGHNPTELEVTLRTARSLTSGTRDRRLPAARRRADAPAAPASSAQALGLADAAIVTDIIGARDAPREGVSGKLVVDSLPPEVRAGLGADARRRRDARARLGAARAIS